MRYIYCIRVFYEDRKNTINIIILIIIASISIIGIYKINTDNDIQNNLDASSQVNRRLIGYYVNEVKGQFYLSNRIITEFSDLDIEKSLERSNSVSTNMLNIVLLDEDNEELYNVRNRKLNHDYVESAIESSNKVYNSIGISNIFYDMHYGQYVFYMSGRLLDHENNGWRNTIGVVSADNLINMLSNNDIHSSKMITLLNDRKIMYSNTYTENELSYDSYRYLKSNIDSSYGVRDSIFDVNKYDNMQDIEVYGNYSNINNKSVVVYGSYGAIDDTNWQFLYEEPTQIAQKRVMKEALDLLVNISYKYIEQIIQFIG